MNFAVRGGGSTPVHDRRVGLVFELPAKIVMAQVFAQFVEPALRIGGRLFQFPLAVRMQALRAVQSPDLDGRIQDGRVSAQQGSDFLGGAARDDHNSCSALALDAPNRLPHPVQGRALNRSTRNGASVPS